MGGLYLYSAEGLCMHVMRQEPENPKAAVPPGPHMHPSPAPRTCPRQQRAEQTDRVSSSFSTTNQIDHNRGAAERKVEYR